jgi:hypothetical protein
MVILLWIDCLTHFSIAVLEFDRKPNGEIGQLGQQILKKRFMSFNKVWMANVYDQQQPGSGGGNNFYFDDSDRLMSANEQEVSLMNSANYFNDKVSFVG